MLCSQALKIEEGALEPRNIKTNKIKNTAMDTREAKKKFYSRAFGMSRDLWAP